MCGILGALSAQVSENTFRDSLATLHHRGPDARGQQRAAFGGKTLFLGHSRLSIIDLQNTANQPMIADEAPVTIIFNGEIYNYRELRADLAARGAHFKTESDTEVLLKAYLHWGEQAFSRLHGMFAFAIHDASQGRLLLCRDPLGIKPLYYHRANNGDLFFASELKALFALPNVPRKISRFDLFQCLNTGFPFEPFTGFEDILKVPPGMVLSIEESGAYDLRRYFQFDLTPPSSIDAVQKALVRSCNEQLVSDVPLGLLFSGGTDSTAIAALVKGQKPTAYFVQYDSESTAAASITDDSLYVDEIAQRLNMDLVTMRLSDQVSSNDILADIRHVAEAIEEPISDFTFLASEQICSAAKKAGATVVLSGMGGDEAFAGYPRYRAAQFWPVLHKLGSWIKLASKIARHTPSLAKKADRFASFAAETGFETAYLRLLGYFSRSEIRGLMSDEPELSSRLTNHLQDIMRPFPSLSPLKQAMVLDLYGFLSHNLTVADKSSMRAGVEMRVPLLDLEVYELALRLPDNLLISGGKNKSVLKKIIEKTLPRDLVHRPKTGFNPPLDSRINLLGREGILDEVAGPIENYINIPAARRHIDDHFSSRANNSYKLWQLLFLSHWVRAQYADV